MSYTIDENMEVTLHFSLSLESGEVIDSTFENKAPGVFNIGDETLPEGFEKLLMGLQSGDRRSFVVPAEQAFGAWRQENVQRFTQETLEATTDEPLSLGLGIVFQDAAGQNLTGVIATLPDDETLEENPNRLVDVDFNHPLAGKNLNFAVEIIDVKPSAQAVELKPLS